VHRLYKSRKNKVIDGVCGGIGEYFGIDPVIIRLLWVALFFAYGSGIILYIIAMIIIPPAPINREREQEEVTDSSSGFKDEFHKNERRNDNFQDKRVISIVVALFLIFIGASLMLSLLTPFNFFQISWKIIVSLILIAIGGSMVYGFIRENKR